MRLGACIVSVCAGFAGSVAFAGGGTLPPGNIAECYVKASTLLRDIHRSDNPAERYGSEQAGPGKTVLDRLVASNDPARPTLSGEISAGLVVTVRDGKWYELSPGSAEVVVYNVDGSGNRTGQPSLVRNIPEEVVSSLANTLRARFRQVWGFFNSADGTDPMGGETTFTTGPDSDCTASSGPRYTESQRANAARKLKAFIQSCRTQLTGRYGTYLGVLASGGCGVNFSVAGTLGLAQIEPLVSRHAAGAAGGGGESGGAIPAQP